MISENIRKDIANDYRLGMTIQGIADARKIHRLTVGKIVAASGVPKPTGRSHRLSTIEQENIIMEYQCGKTTYEISASRGMNQASIWAFLHRRGLTRNLSESQKSHDVDESVFDTINENSAYWAGMMMADGCISDTDGTSSVNLSLHIGDQNHVARFREFLGSSHKLRTSRAMSCLSIRSARLAAAMISLGITPRKSHTAKAASILSSNVHFWRGCIDGDGSIMLLKANPRGIGLNPKLHLCGASIELLQQFLDFVRRVCPSFRGDVSAKSKGAYSVSVGGRLAIKMIRCLYSGCRVALDRKNATAQKIITMADHDPMWCRRLRGHESPDCSQSIR